MREKEREKKRERDRERERERERRKICYLDMSPLDVKRQFETDKEGKKGREVEVCMKRKRKEPLQLKESIELQRYWNQPSSGMTSQHVCGRSTSVLQ